MTLAFPELRDELVERLRRFVIMSTSRSAKEGEVDDIVEFFVGVLEQFRHRSELVGQLVLTVVEMGAVDAFIDELERVAYAHADFEDELLDLPEWAEVTRLAKGALEKVGG